MLQLFQLHLLFVIGIELLARALQNDNSIKGVNIGKKEIKVITFTECIVLYEYNNISNKQALNVTLLLAKNHIFATSSCNSKLSFESFLLLL